MQRQTQDAAAVAAATPMVLPGPVAPAAARPAQPGATSLSPSPTLLDILSTPRSEAAGASAGRGNAPSPSPAVEAPPEQGEASSATRTQRESAREAFLEGLGQEEEDEEEEEEEEEASFFGWTKTPPATAPSEELRDLVRVCTAAHRIGRGNFVWLCWEGNRTNSRSMPSHGTTLVAFTAAFARAFAEFLQNASPGAFGLDSPCLAEVREGAGGGAGMLRVPFLWIL